MDDKDAKVNPHISPKGAESQESLQELGRTALFGASCAGSGHWGQQGQAASADVQLLQEWEQLPGPRARCCPRCQCSAVNKGKNFYNRMAASCGKRAVLGWQCPGQPSVFLPALEMAVGLCSSVTPEQIPQGPEHRN